MRAQVSSREVNYKRGWAWPAGVLEVTIVAPKDSLGDLCLDTEKR